MEPNPFEIVTNSYNPSAATCTKVFKVVNTVTGTVYTGNWLTFDANGALRVDRNRWGDEKVKIRIEYDGSFKDSTEIVTVKGTCPSETTGTISGSPFSFTIPNT